MGRLHGSDANLAMIQYRRTSALKTMDDRYSTAGLKQTKVDVYNRNGKRRGYVEEDQDGFGGVERASFGELESNGGYGMDQEWKQGLSMSEGMKFATQIGKAHRAFEPLPGSTPNFTNQSETVRNHSTLCSEVLKLPTKSFYPSNNHMNHVTRNQISGMEI